MVLTRSIAQLLMNKFNNTKINQELQKNAPVMNYLLSPFEGNINHGDPQELKIYPQLTNEIEKEPDTLVI